MMIEMRWLCKNHELKVKGDGYQIPMYKEEWTEKVLQFRTAEDDEHLAGEWEDVPEVYIDA